MTNGKPETVTPPDFLTLPEFLAAVPRGTSLVVLREYCI